MKLSQIFPAYVVFEMDVVGTEISAVYPEEEQAIHNSAFKRKREYAAGRACAHKRYPSLE